MISPQGITCSLWQCSCDDRSSISSSQLLECRPVNNRKAQGPERRVHRPADEL